MDELILEDIPEEGAEEQEFNLATIASVTTGGVTLIFDGQTEASDKLYKVNTVIPFAVGDRVRIKKDSGTYLVEFVVGLPYSDYPIPSGGTSGQVLAKSSNNNYAVTWTDAAHGIPSGGTTGQVLSKSSNSNYAVEWATPSAQQLKNGGYTVTLNASGALVPGSSSVAIGSSGSPFTGLYANGQVYLGNSYNSSVHIGASSGSTLSFFGHTAASRQTVANTATVATLITALKAYGLIN